MSVATTYWYLFAKPAELHNLLMACEPSVLFTPYQMFRFEQSGSGRYFLLLAVQNHPLSSSCASAPLVVLAQDMKQYDVQWGEGVLQDGSSHLEPKPETRRVCLTHQDTQESLTGWAFLLREGNHLLAALGFTEVPPHTPLQWALFHVPVGHAQAVVEQHLALGRHQLRCSQEIDKKHWILVQQPELYLLLKWKNEPGIRLYQSFPGAENLMTPLGYQSPLANQCSLPSGQKLLVLDLEGESEYLDVSSWWQPTEIIALPPNIDISFVPPQQEPIRVVVKLRYLKAETLDIPRIWLLDKGDALFSLEQLVLLLPPQERNALQLFAGQVPGTSGSVFVVKDDRPQLQAPLFSPQEATGFLPLLAEMNLFVQQGHCIQPVLPAVFWQRDLQLSPTVYSLLLPPEPEQEFPSILRWHTKEFVPFSSLVEYKLAGLTQELQPLARATVFELLFEPIDLPPTQPVLSVAQKARATTTPPLVSDPPSYPSQDAIAAEETEVFVHPSDLRASLPSLQRLELSIRKRNQRLNNISPQDWLALGRLYVEEYKQHTHIYWLQEAASCLDQVFRLDRQSEAAVVLEKEMHELALQLKNKGDFTSLMRQLDEFIVGESRLHARFAFRYRVRMLMQDHLPVAEASVLRQKFYVDLAHIDPFLVVAEHYIFVEGAAQWLHDQELLSRARQSFRQGIQNPKLLWQTLPAVARP